MTTTLQPQYLATTTFTVTGLDGLASSASYLAGWQTDEINIATLLALGSKLAGIIKTGATATNGERIEIWAFEVLDGANKYADVISNAGQGAKTLTAAGIKNAGGRLCQVLTMNGTGSLSWPFAFDLLDVFPFLPKKVVFFITHNCGSNFAAAGNNFFYNTGANVQNV